MSRKKSLANCFYFVSSMPEIGILPFWDGGEVKHFTPGERKGTALPLVNLRFSPVCKILAKNVRKEDDMERNDRGGGVTRPEPFPPPS